MIIEDPYDFTKCSNDSLLKILKIAYDWRQEEPANVCLCQECEKEILRRLTRAATLEGTVTGLCDALEGTMFRFCMGCDYGGCYPSCKLSCDQADALRAALCTETRCPAPQPVEVCETCHGNWPRDGHDEVYSATCPICGKRKPQPAEAGDFATRKVSMSQAEIDAKVAALREKKCDLSNLTEDDIRKIDIGIVDYYHNTCTVWLSNNCNDVKCPCDKYHFYVEPTI